MIPIDSQLAIALEKSEAAYWCKYYNHSYGLNSPAKTIAGAFAGAVPALDVLALNRVIGLGMSEPVSTDHIDEIVDFYRTAGSKRFFIQLSPHATQNNIREMLLAKGFRHHNNWAKLLRKAETPLPTVESKLSIKKVTLEDAETYGKMIYDSFDWDDPRMFRWLSSTVGKEGYQQFLIMLDDVPVGAAALHIMDIYASMAFAGTLTDYRGLGGQSLLLQTRIKAAKEAGCRYMISETSEQKPDKPVMSYRNMLRFGFEVAYLRENWILELT
ncbi:MAG: GNAT family N-acetyltransferase [Calditrichota bacterium]